MSIPTSIGILGCSLEYHSPQAAQPGKTEVLNISCPTSQKAVTWHQFAFTIIDYNYHLLSRENTQLSSHCIVYKYSERPSIKNVFFIYQKESGSFEFIPSDDILWFKKQEWNC